MTLAVALLCVTVWVDAHAQPVNRGEGPRGQAWNCTEPHSNLHRQFWQQDPEKWQEAREHGDGAKNS